MRYGSIYLPDSISPSVGTTYAEIGGPWAVGIVAPAALTVDLATGRLTYRLQRGLDYEVSLVATVRSSASTALRARLRVGAQAIGRTEVEIPVGSADAQLVLADLVRLEAGDELRVELQSDASATLTISRATLRVAPAALV